jgi:hypothetical protein
VTYQVLGKFSYHRLVDNGSCNRLKHETQVEIESVSGILAVVDPNGVAEDFDAQQGTKNRIEKYF